MSFEMESMWQGVKKGLYHRTAATLAAKIRESNDMKEALTEALGTVVTAMRAETGTLWFYEKGGSGRIYPRAVYDGADLSGISLRPGEGIAGQVIENGEALIVRDCQADPRWAGRVDSKTGFVTRSMICVPLTAGEHTFGCIQIINQVNGDFFDDKDLEFAAQLGKEVVSLLKEQGLLPEYAAKAQGAEDTADIPSFRELIIKGSAKEMERLLYAMPEFSGLGARRQMEALQLCRQLRECFAKKR